MKKSSFYKTLVILFVAVAIIGLGFFAARFFAPEPLLIEQEKTVAEPEIAVTPPQDAAPQDQSDKLPKTASIDVPFLSQAPFGVWDALHEDACEEASLIIVKHFIEKKPVGSKESTEKEIQELVKFEKQNGYKASITLKELAEIAKDYYGLKSGRVENNITIEAIKKEIAVGRPVIVGAAGKILPNPNFRNGGPNYHMLVIKGYNQNGFVTNDPGTRKGEDFFYTFNDLFNAIHDWNADNILNGAKKYLVFD